MCNFLHLYPLKCRTWTGTTWEFEKRKHLTQETCVIDMSGRVYEIQKFLSGCHELYITNMKANRCIICNCYDCQ